MDTISSYDSGIVLELVLPFSVKSAKKNNIYLLKKQSFQHFSNNFIYFSQFPKTEHKTSSCILSRIAQKVTAKSLLLKITRVTDTKLLILIRQSCDDSQVSVISLLHFDATVNILCCVSNMIFVTSKIL